MPKVILPALILREVLVVVDIVVVNVVNVPDFYSTLSNIVVASIEPLVAGCLLRIVYMWNREEYRPIRRLQDSTVRPIHLDQGTLEAATAWQQWRA